MQVSLEVFCTCERRSEKNVPAEKMVCNRQPKTDFDEKCLQKFEVWLFVAPFGRDVILGVPCLCATCIVLFCA